MALAKGVAENHSKGMAEHSPNAALTARIEEQLALSGIEADVEASDGTLILSGFVDTEEARQAATDIASQIAPSVQIDNQLEVQSTLPTDIDTFASDEPTAEMADTTED